MNALRPPGHTRIHMTSVGKKLAPKILFDVARLEATSRIYVMSSKKASERQARVGGGQALAVAGPVAAWRSRCAGIRSSPRR